MFRTIPLPILLLLVLLHLLLFPPLSTSDETTLSAYEVLRSHGLPIGLLPKGVKGFDWDANGRFEAHLEGPCMATFESGVRYEATISGSISHGEISSVSGISAQDLFLWFPVHKIIVEDPNSGLIYFDVGVVRKQFSLSLFETPPDCDPISPSPSESGNTCRDVDGEHSGVDVM